MEENGKQWFAMRATYGRNMMAQRQLESWGLESFVPTRQLTKKRGHSVKTNIVPIVRDLIFVHSTKEDVQEAKAKIDYLHYITRPVEGRNTPIEVPTEQMEQFMLFCECGGEVVASGDEVEFRVGERVRVAQGALKGIEGRLVKIQGRRARCFTVYIEGVCTAMLELRKEDLERIDN